MRRWLKLEYAHASVPYICTNDDVNAKFSTSGDETDYYAGILKNRGNFVDGTVGGGWGGVKSFDIK